MIRSQGKTVKVKLDGEEISGGDGQVFLKEKRVSGLLGREALVP